MNILKKLSKSSLLFYSLSISVSLVTYLILYKIYMPKINAFGCFDDCFNFMGGYFILKGKLLYSQIFFNHQPLPAYISFLIQKFFNPVNIYELVLKHRQAVFLFSFVMNVLIILRFGWAGFGFMLFYEFSKFYLFGDRFLAEGIIVYPLVFLCGLIWQKFQNKKLFYYDYLFAAIFTWFIVFMREPYILAAIFAYILILWGMSEVKIKFFTASLFIVLSLITFFLNSPRDYVFNVFTVNSGTISTVYKMGEQNSLLGIGGFKAFFYPIYIIVSGEWNIFGQYLLGLDMVFILSFFFLLMQKKRIKLLVIVLLFLGLANLRAGTPGKVYYEAFHMLSWYSLFIFIMFLMLKELYVLKKKVATFLLLFLFIIFGYFVSSPNSFIHDKVNVHYEFITNYGNYLQVGEVVKKLSGSSDTLFLERADDLIYWQADRLSSYKYSWYTSLMPVFPVYQEARIDMFTNNPPDFYYDFCTKQALKTSSLPESVKDKYQRLYSQGNPTCLYIKKGKISRVSKEQWKKAKELLYELPEINGN